jgi:site-specific recombinase XerD
MRDIDEETWHAYERDLRSRRLSEETVSHYRADLAKLSAFLPETGLLAATAAQVTGWLASTGDPASGYSSSSHASFFRRIRTFYAWAERMEYLDGPSPVAKLRAPREDSPLIPVPDPADITAVLAACTGKDFRSRRDLAIMRLMLETGTPRASAIAALRRDQVDLRRDQVTVLDKGRKERVVPFGGKAAHALTLYLRARAAHPKAASDRLFIGPRGPMTRDGIYQVVAARCQLAGVPVISPHKWRHFTADQWFRAGGSEGDAMALFGWDHPAMPHRYARQAAARRAQDHARDAALADRL